VLVWSPLAGGFLTGKYTRQDPAGGGGRRAAFSVPPIDLDRGYQAIDLLRQIADAHTVPVAHVACAWALAKPAVSSLIVGASNPDHVADNLAAADLRLGPEEVAALDALDPPAPIYPDPRWLTGESPEG
jgi:aryl-alcohol dehydrogenase-like predicted oxidoreductase